MKKDFIKNFIDEINSTPPYKSYETNNFLNSHIDEIWSIDLADMIDCKTSNIKQYRYTFSIIDNFSKCAWCIPLKNKNSQIITKEDSNILTTSKRTPLNLEPDRGAAFYNTIFQKSSKSKIIHHFSRYTDIGSSMAERFTRTIRNLLKKPVFEKGKANWISELPSVVKKYIVTIHSSTKLTPIEASKKGK